MANNKILDYAQKSLEEGYSIEQISTVLAEQGWNPKEINEALLQALKAREIIQRAGPVALPAPPKKYQRVPAPQVLLYLGGLIVVLAGMIYKGINWSQWGSEARIFAIFLPMLICYGVGTSLFFGGDHKKQGTVFLVVGALLFPLFLSVMFTELEMFARPFNHHFNLSVSLLSFVLYVVSSFIFRFPGFPGFPVWAFLCHSMGFFTYYFYLRFIGVEGFFEQPTMAWLFLVPGTAYMLIPAAAHLFPSLFYDKNEQKNEGYYSSAVGVLILVLSFARLFGETFVQNKGHLAWLLFVFGVAYFLLGVFYEKINFKKYCRGLYFIGTMLVFLSLFWLAIGGTLLQDLQDFTGITVLRCPDIIGWSCVIVGVIYLVLAYALEKLKNLQLEEAPKFKGLFNLIAPFSVLGGIFFLGLEGKKPAYETLLLLSSLGFIFGSTLIRVKQYLIIGTLFLVIYIFSIGVEYFHNKVSWPIILFVAGIATMGIGVVMERVRRKYFAVVKS